MSYSPLIHALVGAEYENVQLKKERLEAFVKGGEYDGFNVTMPFKKTIIPYLDEVSETAELCKSVNTVMRRGGKLYGYNTDAKGIEYMIARSGVDMAGKTALILGGGATKDTAAYVLQKAGADVRFVSREGKVNYENCYDIPDVQVIVNTTPVGSLGFSDKPLIDTDKFKNLIAVFDCVYNPYFTPLLKAAKNRGLVCGHGLDMLVAQALASEEVWRGESFSADFADAVLSQIKKKTLNIVLIGMPSCGKSTLARSIAEKTGLRFFDTDKIMEEREKTSCENIYTVKGESYFRALESDVIKSLEGVRGAVIATGGGSVERSENMDILTSNAVVFYVERRLDLLETTGRALSKAIGVEKIYEKRRHLYEAAYNFRVKNNGYICECVNEVIKQYEDFCH